MRPSLRNAFTLVELLVVVGVIVVMMSLAVPAFNSIRGGTDLTSEVYDISGTLEQARAYAMSYNTYVLVGIIETSATQSSSAPVMVSGTGRVSMAVIASRDGTRPYQSLINSNFSGSPTWSTIYSTGTAAFFPLNKLNTYPSLHLVDLQLTPADAPNIKNGTGTPGNMARPSVDTAQYYDIPNANCISSTPFAWPMGSRLTSGNAQYVFNKVIEFDPQGSARIIQGSPSPNLDSIPHVIEIGLEPSSGVIAVGAPATTAETTGKFIAIQIDGMSGVTRIYRP